MKELLGDLAVGICSKTEEHVPEEIAKDALQVAKTEECDSLLSIGGGSSHDLAKAISHLNEKRRKKKILKIIVTRFFFNSDFPKVPIVAVPTNYSGSEQTDIFGMTSKEGKMVHKSPDYTPHLVFYDVSYTLTLPLELTVSSGLNAMAHCVEATYAELTNPIIELLALDGIKHSEYLFSRLVFFET